MNNLYYYFHWFLNAILLDMSLFVLHTMVYFANFLAKISYIYKTLKTHNLVAIYENLGDCKKFKIIF